MNEEWCMHIEQHLSLIADRTIQHVSVNALDTGRNAKEVLRTLTSITSRWS